MSKPLTGKVALVTGGSRGLGAATVRLLAEQGADVAFTYVSSEKQAQAVVDEVRGKGGKAVAFRSDQADTSRAQALIDDVVAHFGRLDILVNNAGINGQQPERKPFHEYSVDFWHKIMDVDVNGTFYLSQLGAQQMISQGEGGSIVNISSVMGINPARLQCAFTVAKAGVIMMSRVMALELAPYNIRVNCLCPGSIMTEKTYAKFYSDPVKSESLLSHVPMKRAGNADEIADGILYLSSDYSSYTTGNNLVIDGGWQCGFTRDW